MLRSLGWSTLVPSAVLVALVTGALRPTTRGAEAPRAITAELGGLVRYLAHVSTDKPVYRPGETVYARAFVLDARTHAPAPASFDATVEVRGPRGDTVVSGTAGARDGTLGFTWKVPDEQPGGEYVIVVRGGALGLAPAERKIDLRAFRAPRLKTQIVFARDGYGPGDRVAASLHCERAEGGVPAGARVTVTALVDGAEVHRATTTVNASGDAGASFALPSAIARGDGTLAMTVEDGGVVETASKTIPILLRTVDLALYPEGGDLVAALPTRVYLEARTPARKPADLEVVITDDRGQEASRCRTEHEGRGRCALTPRRGRTYTLRVKAPRGIATAYPLPAVKTDGAVLSSSEDVIGPGEPARLAVGATRREQLTLTVSQREVEVARTTVDARRLGFGRLAPVSVPLPEGVDGVLIATVWASDGAPLAERLLFRAPAHRTAVRIVPDQPRYRPGDQARFSVETRDETGKPVSAVVGVTVTDESVLELVDRREQAPRLPVMVLLESDVRELADAHVYLDSGSPTASLATDLLLGTQGWRRFALRDVRGFLARYDGAARRALAQRLPPPPPPLEMAAFPRAARGPRGALPVPAMAAPPPLVKMAAPGRPRPAGGRALDVAAKLPRGVLAERERFAPEPPAGIGWIREYAHAVRPDRKPRDRVDFADTLYFAAAVRTDAAGHASIRFGLSDAVTSFRATADAVSDHGALGSAAVSVASVQPFFVEAKLPPVVTSGDRLEVPVVLVNQTSSALAGVRVEARGPAGLALGAPPRVTVEAGGRRRVYVPLDTGRFTGKADLTFAATGGNFADVVTRTVDVRPRGFPIEIARGGLLEPGQPVRIPLALAQGIAAGSLVTEIVAYPTPLASLTQALERLLQEPYGCFEQTSSTTYPLTMAQRYFTTHAGVDPALVARAGSILERGYARLTSFECKDEGYEWFGGAAPGHEALTAYGLMQFEEMKRSGLAMVDDAMVQRTRAWLLGRRDGKGGFLRNQRALDSFGGAPAPTTDAYIVWALLQSGQHGLEREVAAVEKSAASSSDSYVIALGANVAAISGHPSTARALMQKLAARQDGTGAVTGAVTSITRSGGQSLAVETTSLATLAWLRDATHAGHVERAIRFLAASCEGGRFASTQATILALKAIVAYDAARARPKSGGSLSLALDGRPIAAPTTFGPDSEGAIVLPPLAGLLTPGSHSVELLLTGAARMPYSFAVRYRSPTPANAEASPLSLATSLSADTLREGDTTDLRVQLVNQSREAVASPVAIIGIPAGLEVRQAQLGELVKAERIAAYETTGREVVLYWRQLPAGARVEVPLSLVASYPGLTRAPASRAYPYYTDEAKRWVSGTSVEVLAADRR